MDLNALCDLPPWDWPADAGETLLAALRSKPATDDEDRLLAVELASDSGVMNDDIAGALLDILRDPAEPETIRGSAAIALGPTLEELDMDLFDGYEEDGPPVSEAMARSMREGLRQVKEDGGAPKLVRRRALEASVRGMADWHAAEVREAYKSGDDEWRLTAVFCMSFVPGFEREIMEALEGDNRVMLLEAVRAAGKRELAAAWPHIRGLIRSRGAGDREMLLAAIDAAPTIRPEAVPEALGDLADSDDQEIAAAVEEALMMANGLLGLAEDEYVDENADEELPF